MLSQLKEMQVDLASHVADLCIVLATHLRNLVRAHQTNSTRARVFGWLSLCCCIRRMPFSEKKEVMGSLPCLAQKHFAVSFVDRIKLEDKGWRPIKVP